MDKVRGPNSNHDANGPEAQNENKQVARIKWGIYNYPFLRIAENQE